VSALDDNASNFIFVIKDTGDTLVAQLAGTGTNNENADYFYFADGTVWDKAEAMRLRLDRNLRPGPEKLFRT